MKRTAGLRLKVVKKTATRRVKQSCDYLVQSHGLPISRTVGGCRFCSGLLCNVGRKAMSKIDRRSALGIGLAAATAAMMKPAAAQTTG